MIKIYQKGCMVIDMVVIENEWHLPYKVGDFIMMTHRWGRFQKQRFKCVGTKECEWSMDFCANTCLSGGVKLLVKTFNTRLGVRQYEECPGTLRDNRWLLWKE